MGYMSVVLAFVVLAVVLVLGRWLLWGWIRRRKGTVLDLDGSVGDMFQQIEDKYRPPCQEEIACRIAVAKARSQLAACLFPRIFEGLRGFRQELEEAGFTVEFDFDLALSPELEMRFVKEPFLKLHESVEYAAGADRVAVNKAFVEKTMDEWLGDAGFYRGFDQECEECPAYRISCFVHNLGGKTRQILGESFFEGLSSRTKRYVGLKEDLIGAQIKSEKKREQYARSLPGKVETVLLTVESWLGRK